MDGGPIDFSAMQYQPDVLKDFGRGVDFGNGLRQMQDQRAQQASYKADLQSYMQQPTAQSASAFALKYPKLGEAVQKNWSTLNADQQANELKDLGVIASAYEANRPDIVAKTFQSRIQAQERAGMDTSQLKSLASMNDSDPTQARARILAYTAAVPGGADVLKNLASIGTERRSNDQAPADLLKKQADASKAAAEAGNTPTKLVLDNANTQSLIADRTAGQRIAELNTQISQANSETQRGQLVLERDKLVQAQAEKAKEVGSGAQDQLDAIRSSLQTVQAVANHEGINNTFTYGGVGSLRGAIEGTLPGTARTDLQGLVDTLKAQQFLTGIKQMQGMGALSNSEGDKIGAAVASLNLNQSPGAFKNALGVIKSTLERAEKKAVGSGKLSTTSPTFVATVPGIGNVTDGMVNKLLAENPGATREQVMQYLNSQTKPAGATGGY